jgi:hypothetical protein
MRRGDRKVSEINNEINEELIDECSEEDKGRKAFNDFVSRHGNIFTISALVHLFVLVIIALLPSGDKKKVETILITDTKFIKVDEPEKLPDPPVVEFKDTSVFCSVDIPVHADAPDQELPISQEEQDPLEVAKDNMVEVAKEMPLQNQAQNEAILGVLNGLGQSVGNGSEIGLIKSRRGPGKDEAIKKHKVKKESLNAVEKGLKWLAEHQSKDGSWDVEKYEGQSNHKSIEAVSAAAVLAFLGNGHSERQGGYKKNVMKSVRYLNKAVSAKFNKPHFGRNYGSALILMALSESSMFGSSSITKKNANAIAAMFVDQFSGKGWHYNGSGTDLSVSGWIALGLKSALAAELPVMKSKKGLDVMEQYKVWITQSATSDETGMGYYNGGRGGSPHMTWVGMFQRRFLGFGDEDLFLKKAALHSEKWVDSGKWVGRDQMGDIYGIYYGTLACFYNGGKLWKKWDRSMNHSLVGSQCVGSVKELGGSWNPTVGHTAKSGGRVLTTALSVLCLEVYYRLGMM